MSDNKKLINGKLRNVHIGKKGGKYYVSKGKKVYFGGTMVSKMLKKKKKPKKVLKSFSGPRRMNQSLSSSSGSFSSSNKSSSPKSPLRRCAHKKLPIKPIVYERLIKPGKFQSYVMYDSKGNVKKIPSNISSNELDRAINEGRIFMSSVNLPPTKNKRNYKKPKGKTITELLTGLVGEKYVAEEINQLAGRERARVRAGDHIPLSYRVSSQARGFHRGLPGQFYYLTDMRDGKYHCSCPNYFMKNEKNTGKKTPLPKGQGCKHIRGFVDGTQRVYRGHDLTMKDRIQILREQIASGERNHSATEYLDPVLMKHYLTANPLFFPFNTDEGLTIPEQEKSLFRFQNQGWYAEPYERRSEYYRDQLDNYPNMTPMEYGNVRRAQYKKDNAYPQLTRALRGMKI